MLALMNGGMGKGRDNLNMMIGNQFDNDPDWIQQIQHDLYWSVVTIPYATAREKYIKAERIIGIETQLGQDCRDMDRIDHRVLQYFHDAIATRFRYEFNDPFQKRLPCILEGNTEEEDIKRKWIRFYNEQIECLFDEYQDLPRQTLIAGTYPNPDERGKDAEDSIYTTCLKFNSHLEGTK